MRKLRLREARNLPEGPRAGRDTPNPPLSGPILLLLLAALSEVGVSEGWGRVSPTLKQAGGAVCLPETSFHDSSGLVLGTGTVLAHFPFRRENLPLFCCAAGVSAPQRLCLPCCPDPSLRALGWKRRLRTPCCMEMKGLHWTAAWLINQWTHLQSSIGYLWIVYYVLGPV